MKYEVREIPLGEIDVSGRLRQPTRDAVEGLAAEIEADGGLRSPVEVSPAKGGKFKYRLTFGGHRYEAFRLLGRETIPAFIRDQDELQQPTEPETEIVILGPLAMGRSETSPYMVIPKVGVGLCPTQLRQL